MTPKIEAFLRQEKSVDEVSGTVDEQIKDALESTKKMFEMTTSYLLSLHHPELTEAQLKSIAVKVTDNFVMGSGALLQIVLSIIEAQAEKLRKQSQN